MSTNVSAYPLMDRSRAAQLEITGLAALVMLAIAFAFAWFAAPKMESVAYEQQLVTANLFQPANGDFGLPSVGK